MTDQETLKNLIRHVMDEAGIPIPQESWPIIIRKGENTSGRTVCYYLNYSGKEQNVWYNREDGTELLTGNKVSRGSRLTLPAWGVQIIEFE